MTTSGCSRKRTPRATATRITWDACNQPSGWKRARNKTEKNGLGPAPLNPEAAYRVATAKQLEILNAIDKFEDTKRKVRVAANQLLADLKIVADASLASDAPPDYG